MPASISLVFRVAIMTVILVTVFFTMQAYVNDTTKSETYLHLKRAAEYIESKLYFALKAISQFNGTVRQQIDMPQLSARYTASLSCDNNDQLLINVSAEGIGRKYIIPEFINCSGALVSGTVFPGQNCLEVEKVYAGSTLNISLVKDCGIL